MIKQIKFVGIPVADQGRALDFYTDKGSGSVGRPRLIAQIEALGIRSF
jgi:hypothetical protein